MMLMANNKRYSKFTEEKTNKTIRTIKTRLKGGKPTNNDSNYYDLWTITAKDKGSNTWLSVAAANQVYS